MEIILFIFPVQNQIEMILNKLYPHLCNRNLEEIINSLFVSDVTSSNMYKELITKHNFSSNDITLTWNTDGIPIFNLSNYAIWPLQATINRLANLSQGKTVRSALFHLEK